MWSTPPPDWCVSRREVLLSGTFAVSGIIAGCSSDGGDSGDSCPSSPASDTDPEALLPDASTTSTWIRLEGPNGDIYTWRGTRVVESTAEYFLDVTAEPEGETFSYQVTVTKWPSASAASENIETKAGLLLGDEGPGDPREVRWLTRDQYTWVAIPLSELPPADKVKTLFAASPALNMYCVETNQRVESNDYFS